MKVFSDALKTLKSRQKSKKKAKTEIGESLMKSGFKQAASTSTSKSFPKLRRSIRGPKSPGGPTSLHIKQTRIMPTGDRSAADMPGYAKPHAKIGTNVKNRVRKSGFGTIQRVEGTRAFTSGQAEDHQFGAQSVSTGGNRRHALSGSFGEKVKRKAKKARAAKSLLGHSSAGRLAKRPERLGSSAPVKKG